MTLPGDDDELAPIVELRRVHDDPTDELLEALAGRHRIEGADADDLLASLTSALPNPPLALRIGIAVLATAQLVVVLPGSSTLTRSGSSVTRVTATHPRRCTRPRGCRRRTPDGVASTLGTAELPHCIRGAHRPDRSRDHRQLTQPRSERADPSSIDRAGVLDRPGRHSPATSRSDPSAKPRSTSGVAGRNW
ncbi:MAG: hypothetical protein R2710_08500 [Acidimicrobiales bacterium]